MPENEETGTEEIAEAAEEIAEEIAEEVAEEVAEETVDVDVTVIEAPKPEEPEAKFASVDVGDLHISGPAEMVEKITKEYLKDHIDHNPHGENHTSDDGGIVETLTPDVVEEQIQDAAADETADVPPGPTDWLFRQRGA